MMREHMGLYRGKRKDNGEWVEGSLLVFPHSGRTMIFDRYDLTFYRVDPDTVGECTGLPDKNGKLIFEGDIVDYLGEYGKIEYDRDDARFVVLFDGWCTDFSHLRGKDVEIIGNIHDNPELLQQEE